MDMFENTVNPPITEIVETNPNKFDLDIVFQQNGAPPHCSKQVRNYLDNNFPDRWIGRGGPVEWPARSPDLTPLEFFLWGYLKQKVYETEPVSVLDNNEYL